MMARCAVEQSSAVGGRLIHNRRIRIRTTPRITVLHLCLSPSSPPSIGSTHYLELSLASEARGYGSANTLDTPARFRQR